MKINSKMGSNWEGTQGGCRPWAWMVVTWVFMCDYCGAACFCFAHFFYMCVVFHNKKVLTALRKNVLHYM